MVTGNALVATARHHGAQISCGVHAVCSAQRRAPASNLVVGDGEGSQSNREPLVLGIQPGADVAVRVRADIIGNARINM